MKKRAVCLGFLFFAGVSSAIIFYSTGDSSYNTNAPSGALENSGWQFPGRFGSYIGTPVGPHHFITATHIGGTVGSSKLYYGGETFTTTAKTNDAASDLTVLTVAERFSSYAPLYDGSSEVGKTIVVIGRGVERGVAVTNTLTTGHGQNQTTLTITNGWKWGSNTKIQRWGTNQGSATATLGVLPVLKVNWDAVGGEFMLATGDSSGGAFIRDDGVWKLAGVNYSVGPYAVYSFSPDGAPSFPAAIVDFSGDSTLYGRQIIGAITNWVAVSSFQKSSSYMSRISSRYSWVTNVIGDEFDEDVDLLPD